jgi:glycosyltransferase involved in cell wall biosynthesis
VSERARPATPLLTRTRRRIEAAASLWLRPDYSVLSVVADAADWVLDTEARAIVRVARGLGIRARADLGLDPRARQCRHYASQFILEDDAAFATRHRISLDYLHGTPGSHPAFARLLEALGRRQSRVERVRVSHAAMERCVLEAGIAPAKVHRIALGVDVGMFAVQTPASRAAARARLGLPAAALVVGSFQKDGVGWGEGLEPKLIKGPDVLVDALDALRARVRDVCVLLTGPARGFVKRGLEQRGIPYRHRLVGDHAEIGECYQALDVYVVASREEGGPKAVLEAMASGVPLVTTRVGQAADLVVHRENGLLVEIEDKEALADAACAAVSDTELRAKLVAHGRRTAEANSYEAQRGLWARFFEGFVATT